MFNIKYILQEEEGGSTPPPSGGNPPPAAPSGMMGGDTPPPAAPPSGDTPPPAGWNYAEGIAGTGDKPDWLISDKYKTVEAQAQAYSVLNERFRGFNGSPEEFTRPEGFGEGEAAIMASTIQDIAKDSNMNQDTYNKILETVATNVEGYRDDLKAEQADAARKSITNFENRETATFDAIKTVLNTDQLDGIQELMTTSAGFEAVEILAASVRGHALPGGQPPAQQRSVAAIVRDINASNPHERAALMEELNSKGDGQSRIS